MYEAEYHPKIRKYLKKIDPPIREKITSSYHFRIAKQEYRIAYVADEKSEKVIFR